MADAMRALFDISILLALADTHHVHHERAHRWRRDELGEFGWASCPLTQNGFLRVSSQKSYSTPKPLPEALSLLRQLLARPDHEFWPDDTSILDAVLIDHTRLLGPKQITDVYLLALAVKHGGRLVTLDTGISVQAVRGANAAHLVVV